MSFETVDAPECPIPQRKLLVGVGLFTKELAAIGYPAAKIAMGSTAENVLYVIWLRLLQMSRSIQASCYLGYAHEQQGLVRSMVSAAADLLYIARQPDPPGFAMLYATYSIERRKKIGKGYVKAGIMSQEMFENWDRDQDKKEREAFEQAERKGIKPAAKHKPKKKPGATKEPQSAPTWSGFSDADIIGMSGRPWYASYYVPFSDMAHANIMTAEEELKQLQQGEVSIGPRFPARILLYVLTGVCETMSAGIETIDKHFSLGIAKDIAAHERAVHEFSKEYRDQLPPSPLETLDV